MSRLTRFFQTGLNDIKIYEKEINDEHDALLNNDKENENDDDSSDNENTVIRSNFRSRNRHTEKCNHHQSKTTLNDEIAATKTTIITADERV